MSASDSKFWAEIHRGLGQIAAGLAQIMAAIAKHKLTRTTTQ